jgi:hypothetical protein
LGADFDVNAKGVAGLIKVSKDTDVADQDKAMQLGNPNYSDRAACRSSHIVETVIGTEAEPRECRPARRLTAASIGPGPSA